MGFDNYWSHNKCTPAQLQKEFRTVNPCELLITNKHIIPGMQDIIYPAVAYASAPRPHVNVAHGQVRE